MSKLSTNGRRAAGSLMRRLTKMTRKLVRLDEARIREALKDFGPNDGETLLVHSSLSACGFVDGGPATVINALRGWISEKTLLAMPTHTWSYPRANGETPVYDFQSTPSLVGTITDFFWRQSGNVRSLHPSHSLACVGRDSEQFVVNHETHETPCGQQTPYERIATTNSSVLMFGCTLDSYTLFHTAEDAAKLPYLYKPEKMTLKSRMTDGSILDVPSWRQDMDVARRFAEMADWLEQEKLLKRRTLGRGELLFIPRADLLHERIVKELRREPLLLVAEHARASLKK